MHFQQEREAYKMPFPPFADITTNLGVEISQGRQGEALGVVQGRKMLMSFNVLLLS